MNQQQSILHSRYFCPREFRTPELMKYTTAKKYREWLAGQLDVDVAKLELAFLQGEVMSLDWYESVRKRMIQVWNRSSFHGVAFCLEPIDLPFLGLACLVLDVVAYQRIPEDPNGVASGERLGRITFCDYYRSIRQIDLASESVAQYAKYYSFHKIVGSILLHNSGGWRSQAKRLKRPAEFAVSWMSDALIVDRLTDGEFEECYSKDLPDLDCFTLTMKQS